MQQIAFDPAEAGAALAQLPASQAVFALYGAEAHAEPYIGRTPNLRARLARLLQPSPRHPLDNDSVILDAVDTARAHALIAYTEHKNSAAKFSREYLDTLSKPNELLHNRWQTRIDSLLRNSHLASPKNTSSKSLTTAAFHFNAARRAAVRGVEPNPHS